MKFFFLLLTLSTLFVAELTFAQEPPTPDSPSGFISCEGKSCSACDFVVLGNTAIKWLITISFLFFAVLAVRAGIKLVVSQGNPSALSNAKESFTNAFIGLIIILLAFLLVDTIMRQLVKGQGEIKGYGPWNEVVCSKQVESTIEEGFFKGDNKFIPGKMMSSYTGPAYTGGPLPQCDPGNGSCNVNTLRAAGFNQQQANIMSCIAMTESSGRPETPPYNVTHPNHKPVSTACGLFQITKSTWETVATGDCKNFSQCTNARCNTQNAVKLVRSNGYTPWTCAGCNNKAAFCVKQYGS